MEETEKLDVLLAHWIEHNESHIGTYKEWAEKLKSGGFDDVGAKIEEAVVFIYFANKKLDEAGRILKVE